MDSKEHDIEFYMARGRQLRSEAIRRWFRAGVTFAKRALGRRAPTSGSAALGQGS